MKWTSEIRAHAAAATLAVIVVSALFAPRAEAQPAGVPPEISVTRLAGGRALVEVKDATVSIRKEVSGDASHVTISTRQDEVQLRVVRGQLTASTPGGSVSVSAGNPEEVARLMAVLQRSEAASRGRDLLKRLPSNPRDFGQQSLLLTRAVLELAHGPSAALARHREWLAEERRRAGSKTTMVVKAGRQVQGPGDCWDLYSKEAIRIADDFADCTDDLKWYDALGWSGCSLLYTVRAEAAMFWFISCNGGIPFKG
jgi:hypothetical protein